MINVERIGPAALTVSSENPAHHGLLLHGYGGNKEEMLGLAIHLSERLPLKLHLADLPGHGENDGEFCLGEAMLFLKETELLLGGIDFAVGHSAGARLGLLLSPPIAVAISMPGEIHFEGGRQDLLRTLRARRVRESAPYAGLQDVLREPVEPAAKMLFLRADQELQSVVSLCSSWRDHGVTCETIQHSNHLDILTARPTWSTVGIWLEEALS